MLNKDGLCPAYFIYVVDKYSYSKCWVIPSTNSLKCYFVPGLCQIEWAQKFTRNNNSEYDLLELRKCGPKWLGFLKVKKLGKTAF